MTHIRLSTPGKVLLSIGSIVVTLLLLEFLIRIFGLYPCLESQVESLFEYSDVYGWQFIPNKCAREVAPGEVQTLVKINSTGMRDEEYSLKKPPGKNRIAVLGDSFAANLDVDSADVFTELMKKMLPDNWQVLNFGVNGYGPAQELLLLKNKVIRYEPDIVIMLIYIRNDFDDSAGTMDWIKGYKRPKATLAPNGGIILDLSPTSSPRPSEGAGNWPSQRDEDPLSIRNIYKRSLLYHFIRDRLFYRFNVFMMPEIRLCSTQPSEETAVSYALMKEILREVHRFARDNNIEFITVTAPTIIQVYDRTYWTRVKKKYHLADDQYDLFGPNTFIRKSCAELGIRNLDLTPALRQHAASGESLYYRHNQHWNSQGNRLVARIISDYLLENRLVPAAPQGSTPSRGGR